MPTRVLVVEDHDLLAETVAFALRAEGHAVERLGAVEPSEIETAARAFSPAVVLLDLHLGRDEAIPAIAPLRATGATVIMVTAETDEAVLGACLAAGAAGIVRKDCAFDELSAAVGDAAAGRPVIGAAEHDRLLAALRHRRSEEAARRAPFRLLTARERAVLASLMDGHSAETIARNSYVSLSTVRSQIRSVLLKLGVNSQLAAVALARRHEWHNAA